MYEMKSANRRENNHQFLKFQQNIKPINKLPFNIYLGIEKIEHLVRGN